MTTRRKHWFQHHHSIKIYRIKLKRQKITKNIPIALIADREADEFQANRVGADFFAIKPLSKTKLNNFFNKE